MPIQTYLPKRRTGRINEPDEYVEFDTGTHRYIAQRCGLSSIYNVFINAREGSCSFKESFDSMDKAESYAALLAGYKPPSNA